MNMKTWIGQKGTFLLTFILGCYPQPIVPNTKGASQDANVRLIENYGELELIVARG